MYQKIMFDRYYCIKHFFLLENFSENAVPKGTLNCKHNLPSDTMR